MKRTRSVTVPPPGEDSVPNVIHLEKDDNGEDNYTFSLGFLHCKVKYQCIAKMNIQGWVDDAEEITCEAPCKEITVNNTKQEIDELGRKFCTVVAGVCVQEEGPVGFSLRLVSKDGTSKILHLKMQVLGDNQGHPALRCGVTRLELPHPPTHPDLCYVSEDDTK